MKKSYLILIGLLIILSIVGTALAGLDMFTGKHYTVLVNPTAIGRCYSGEGIITNDTAAVSNTPVSLVSYPGNGALLLSVNPGSGSIVATMYVNTNMNSATSWTNSPFTISTAQNGWSTNQWTFTGKTNQVTLFRPGAEIGKVQVRFDATGVTNGSVAAMVITE